MMFAIPDPQYWQFCAELAGTQSLVNQIDSKAAIDIIGGLRDVDMLKDKIVLKFVNKLSNDLDDMSVDALTEYLTILNSEESKDAHNFQKLDKNLGEKI